MPEAPSLEESEFTSIPFINASLEGTSTSDFEIEKVAYRDHALWSTYIEREIEITYRNESGLARAFSIGNGETNMHYVSLPPNGDGSKVARGRVSITLSYGETPAFVGSLGKQYIAMR